MANPLSKFGIPGDQIREIAPRRGRCFASDMITLHGQRVGYMYRQVPADRGDSGWVFMAGSETQEFMDDPDHIAIYDVNTVVNYDPEIITLLDAAPPCAYERGNNAGRFVAVPAPDAE